MSKTLLFLIVFFIASVASYLFGADGGKGLAVHHFFYLAPSLIAVFFGVNASRLLGLKSVQGKVIILMTKGIFLLFMGEFLWVLYDAVLNTDPYPSMADVFYILSYPFIFLGMIYQIKLNKVDPAKIQKTIALSTLAIMGFGIYWFIQDKTLGFGSDVWENIFKIFYQIADFVLIICNILIFFVIMEYENGKLAKPWMFIFIGLVLMYIADVLFGAYQTEYEAFTYPYNMIDLFWIGSYLFIGFGFHTLGNIIAELQEKLKSIKAGEI